MLSVVGASYARVGESIDRQTAGHIPHRPLLQLARCCAQDVDAFYAQRSRPTPVDEGSPTSLLEVMSGDGKGVRMVTASGRPPTRISSGSSTAITSSISTSSPAAVTRRTAVFEKPSAGFTVEF